MVFDAQLAQAGAEGGSIHIRYEGFMMLLLYLLLIKTASGVWIEERGARNL